MGQRVGELQAAAGHPGVILAFYLQRGAAGQELAGFFDPAVAGVDFAGED